MNQPLTDPEFPTGDFVKGHLSAFEKVYTVYHPGVLRFARELVQDASVTASIVKDSFLKLWIQHADLDSPQNIEAFLHISVQRACFSYLKQVEQLTVEQLKKMSSLVTAPPAISPGSADMRTIILSWFSHLPATTAETARLAYNDGLTDKQIAEQLGIGVEQVKDQKLRGMLLIKEQWFSKSEKELVAFRELLQKVRE